jgi:hypothetical protein
MRFAGVRDQRDSRGRLSGKQSLVKSRFSTVAATAISMSEHLNEQY